MVQARVADHERLQSISQATDCPGRQVLESSLHTAAIPTGPDAVFVRGRGRRAEHDLRKSIRLLQGLHEDYLWCARFAFEFYDRAVINPHSQIKTFIACFSTTKTVTRSTVRDEIF